MGCGAGVPAKVVWGCSMKGSGDNLTIGEGEGGGGGGGGGEYGGDGQCVGFEGSGVKEKFRLSGIVGEHWSKESRRGSLILGVSRRSRRAHGSKGSGLERDWLAVLYDTVVFVDIARG